jgi:hypothetical protein
MEWSPSWEADSHSDSQEMPHLLLNPKVHYRVNSSQLLVPTLSQMHPVHIFSPNIPKIHSNIIIPSTPMSSEWFFPSGFPAKTPCFFYLSVCLSVCLSVYLSIYLSIYLSPSLYHCLFAIYLYIHRSIRTICTAFSCIYKQRDVLYRSEFGVVHTALQRTKSLNTPLQNYNVTILAIWALSVECDTL